ncbi:hypothetical protein [Aliifodinibius sp. S!AR15-10]|uniref:pectate lyase family protein n=1 Tax=Aliifodinibius sp. S!AR15-10 TaxID=2950437 RepID=UPI0028707113|nr:hypothetical protein [Aliifodinibius sp. S!AR15-10]
MKTLTSLIVIGVFSAVSVIGCGNSNAVDSGEDNNGNEHGPTPVEEEAKAFPGAEGFGSETTGGRGGKVIYVTNLNDSGPGSLREAVDTPGARYILFKTSGTIALESDLNINYGDLTIAGQTAPGDGIAVRNYPVAVNANNVIIRYMRFRMGDVAEQQDDGLKGRDQKDIIIDHCSISWGTDETASFYDNENFTMQWCIISESLRNSIHEKGSHGYGGIWGGQKASFHHNLLAHHDSRNPRFCGSRYTNQPGLELIDFRNNVIYNWGGNSSYGAEGGSYNMVNNYFKAGPATSSHKSRIEQPYPDNGGNEQPAGTYGKFYVDGNYVAGSAIVTNDNWQGVHPHSSFSDYGVSKEDLKSGTAFDVADVTMQSAEEAYEKVLDFAGASLVRDTVDARIVYDTRTGTATFTDGGNGSTNGLIDTQSAVGGWPELESDPAPEDSDSDGMPDEWEKEVNLDPEVKETNGHDLSTGYENIEVYINSLVESITDEQK